MRNNNKPTETSHQILDWTDVDGLLDDCGPRVESICTVQRSHPQVNPPETTAISQIENLSSGALDELPRLARYDRYVLLLAFLDQANGGRTVTGTAIGN